MNPAWSVIVFTTVAGAAQGLVVALAMSRLAGLAVGPGFTAGALLVALALLIAGLVSSFLHLGHPQRAWRAVLMWRTSWLSREVIALPAFIAAVALWWWMVRSGLGNSRWLMLLAVALALALWLCTAMIYACLRFIAEWAHALTLANYMLIGLASGCTLLAALAQWRGEAALAQLLSPWALALTLAGWATRSLALRRNASLKPLSTLQSATGIRQPRLRQLSMGMSAGAFNTREFMHGMGQVVVQRVRWALHGLGFAAPALLIGLSLAMAMPALLPLACLVQLPGLLAERWLFFAQARHPQNLYYQVVS